MKPQTEDGGFSPYRELGLDQSACDEDVRKAFRRLVKTAHSDTGGNREVFDRLVRSRDILLNPEARRHFDETGALLEEPPDRTEQAAWQVIGTMLGLALTSDRDPLSVNLVREIENAIAQKIVEGERFVSAGERSLSRLVRLRGRFKRRTKGDNLMESSLAWHEEQLAAGLRNNKHVVAVHKRAIELIREYEFSPEAAGWMRGVSAITG